MFKNLLVIICATFLSSSCEKNTVGNFDASPDVPVQPDKVTDKKGVAFSNKTKAWSHKTHDLAPYWMYSWGNEVKEEIPENVEFVPMFWGKGSVTDANIARIKKLKEEGMVKFVLGFNEPDGSDQANMTVDEVIALWPKLEEIGVPLGSPATVNPNNTWMQEFMKKALTLGLRIDFIAVHHYGGSDAINFIDKLKTTHDAYNRPIWVTEFAVADWSATTPLGNKYNEASVIAFMQEAIKAMDNIDWVQRYAWFDGKNAALYTSALFDSDDKITTLGKLYSGIKSNIKIGPGKDTEYIAPVDVDELLNNGGFETGKIEPWGGFKNGVVTNDGTKPNTGNYAGKIENGDGSLFQVVGVIPGKKYLLKYVSKWNETITNSFTGTIRNNNGNALLFTLKPMPMTNVWEESTYEFTVPTGVTELKIVFYKINGFPPLFLDDVSLKEIK